MIIIDHLDILAALNIVLNSITLYLLIRHMRTAYNHRYRQDQNHATP